ncbi:DNA polymerase III subunit alpha [Candidatus Entotheonellaceae bacterium PAL068K]
MGQETFVHLHLHTEFSLLDGANRIDELLDQAQQFRMPAVAMTDHGNLFGAMKFYKTAKARGIKPILGCEAYISPTTRFDRSPQNRKTVAHHLTLLATNYQGYQNLSRLISKAYLEGFYYRPRIDKELLAEHADGLIGLTGCLKGEVNGHILQGEQHQAMDAVDTYRQIFGPDNLYLELMSHGVPGQEQVNQQLVAFARNLHLPLVATNDCHYLRREDAVPHDILLCIGTGKSVNDPNRMRYSQHEFYFKSAEEMYQVFAEVPEACHNTLAIAERCDLHLPFDTPLLPQYQTPDGLSLDAYLEQVVRQGLEARLQSLRRYRTAALMGREHLYWQRLDKELGIIRATGYAGYFLIVWDFIRYAREHDIPVGPGRGSAAGSLVAYALRITDLDPLAYNLLFERFLNPERVSMPDIDIDFCMQRRDEVIQYVTEKYGKHNVSQIITFGSMLAKGVLRDVGRALDMPYNEVDRIAKLVPNRLNITLDDALQEEPRLQELQETDPQVGRLIDTAQRLEGLTRHASVHAAGVVISPTPLVDFVPLYKGVKGEAVTQYAMDDIEAMGLLKMDFLGLRTLTVLHHAAEMIRDDHGLEIDLAELPLDDPETYGLLSEARTVGVFQLEGRGLRDLLRKLQPRVFEDLVALVALYRPGPLGSGMVDDFIERRHGRREITYALPELEPILRSTYGVIVFQEQVIQIATTLAGFTLGRADLLRRAMGKKKPEVMAEQRESFVRGAVGNGYPEDKAASIFDLIAYFAGYGFNRSHSVAYALIAYQTAYLKAHYPHQFMAALMTSDMDNTDKVIRYIGDCRDLGIPVLPPDINDGFHGFTVSGESIRFGLGAIKGVGHNAIAAILREREDHEPFGSFVEFCERLDFRQINKKAVESLIKGGALDSLDMARAAMLGNMERVLDWAHQQQDDRQQGQISLFGDATASPALTILNLDTVPEWSDSDRLAYEKDVLGFYISSHPLAAMQQQLRRLTTATSQSLADCPNEQAVTVGGIITQQRTQLTKKGERMAFLTLEDLYGSIEIIVFPETYRQSVAWCESEEPLLIWGKTDSEGSDGKIVAQRIMSLHEAEVWREFRRLTLALSPEFDRAVLVQIRDLLAAAPGDCHVVLALHFPDGEQITLRAGERLKVAPSMELLDALEHLLGTESVQMA